MSGGSIHGERYDYSKVVYQNATFDKVIVVCRIHGDFEVTPNNHLHGFNCPVCGRDQAKETRRKSPGEFIDEAKRLHGNRYTYDRLGYTYALEPVIITCGVHGDFQQLASNHLRGAGCPKCSNRYYSWGEEKVKDCLDEWGGTTKHRSAFPVSSIQSQVGIYGTTFALRTEN